MRNGIRPDEFLIELWENNQDVRVVKERLRNEDELIRSLEAKLDDQFFEKLHAKVMAQVEQKADIQLGVVQKLKAKVKPWSVSAVVFGLFLVFVLPTKILNQSPAQYASHQFLTEALSSPESFAILTTNQSQSDFFGDIATQNFDQLAQDHYAQIMSSLSHKQN